MSRLSNALLAALVLHGLLFFVRARSDRPHVLAQPPSQAPELVEVEQAVEETPPPVAMASDNALPSSPKASAALSAASVHAASRAVSSDSASSDALPTDALATDGAATARTVGPSAAASAEGPSRKVDLGLDGHFFLRPPSEELPRAHKSEFQHQLEVSISRADVKHGLARGNVLLGSLDSAVRDVGPVRGDALVRVTVGPDGDLTDVEFLQGAASDWTAALKAFRELARRKRVRVPAGARGLRVIFAVKAKVQLPSGAEAPGPRLATPSLSGDGLVPHGTFDLADIGQGFQRLVYARVVTEEVL